MYQKISFFEMNLAEYLQFKNEHEQQKPLRRQLCLQCLQPEFSCYCSFIKKFDCKIKFIILIHPIEVRRRIATGRMSSLILENSRLIAGQDFSRNPEINDVITNKNNQCFILYPHRNSTNISHLSSTQKTELIDKNKKQLIFVIDGTWATAKKMLFQSKNLNELPKICFSKNKVSNFKVRKQPAPECFSTIEAIHEVIDSIGDRCGFETTNKEHDNLLYVFNKMVERQLYFIEESRKNPKPYYYRREK